MTILELLKDEETPCHMQGRQNCIMYNQLTGLLEVLQERHNGLADYTVELYAGESEADAVLAFQIGERS
jgi:hypothetical protein